MRIAIPILIAGWILTMASAMAGTQKFNTRREPTVQFQTSGVDAEYVHGEHCIDGRSF